MGPTPSHHYIEEEYEIVKMREDGSALLKHRKKK